MVHHSLVGIKARRALLYALSIMCVIMADISLYAMKNGAPARLQVQKLLSRSVVLIAPGGHRIKVCEKTARVSKKLKGCLKANQPGGSRSAYYDMRMLDCGVEDIKNIARLMKLRANNPATFKEDDHAYQLRRTIKPMVDKHLLPALRLLIVAEHLRIPDIYKALENVLLRRLTMAHTPAEINKIVQTIDPQTEPSLLNLPPAFIQKITECVSGWHLSTQPAFGLGSAKQICFSSRGTLAALFEDNKFIKPIL